jgi:Amt family ammonium transporter
MALLITQLCASTSSFTWMLIEWLHTGKPTIIGAVSGAVTGLVVISPAAGFVDHTAAFVMGLIGATLCYGTIFLKNKFGLDQKPNQSNYPDAFGVHSVGGIVGTLIVGFFANPEIGPHAGVWYKVSGDVYTNGEQLGWQFAGVAITIGYTATVTTILLLALKFTIGINNPDEPDEVHEKAIEMPQAAPPTIVHQPLNRAAPSQYPMMGGYPGMAPPMGGMGQPYGMMGGFA